MNLGVIMFFIYTICENRIYCTCLCVVSWDSCRFVYREQLADDAGIKWDLDASRRVLIV